MKTPSNTENKNVDTTPRYKNDNQTGQFGNQRAVNVVGARETVGGPVVQQSGIQCFNCKEFGHYAKECRKPKRVKDSTYHKEKMLLCKQAEKGVQLQAEQSDWLADTDEEIDEQELEAHYSYMANIQEVPNADSGTDAEPLEQVQYDTDDNVFANDIQHFDQSESISNTCAVETGDSNVTPDSPDMCDNDIQDDQNDVECDDERVALANLIANLKLDVDLIVLGIVPSLLAQKEIDIKEGLKVKAYEISVVKEKHDEIVKQSLLTKSHYEGVVKEKTNVITDLKRKEEKDIDKMISMENQHVSHCIVSTTQTGTTVESAFRNTYPCASTMYRSSSPKLITEVEETLGFLVISIKTKSVTACNDSLKSRLSNVNAVCATCGKCVFNSNHDACVSKYLNDVNARTKKPNVVPISTRKPNVQGNKSVAKTPP
ncbi:retrovirus-related pol polyprotein from transposon TNT 1-94 [Tanacetum coccineum]